MTWQQSHSQNVIYAPEKYKDKCIKHATSHSNINKIPFAAKEAAAQHGASSCCRD